MDEDLDSSILITVVFDVLLSASILAAANYDWIMGRLGFNRKPNVFIPEPFNRTKGDMSMSCWNKPRHMPMKGLL